MGTNNRPIDFPRFFVYLSNLRMSVGGPSAYPRGILLHESYHVIPAFPIAQQPAVFVMAVDVIGQRVEENQFQISVLDLPPIGDQGVIDALVAERTQAKKDKNFARADEIRDILTKKGIVVTDTPNGPVWSRN